MSICFGGFPPGAALKLHNFWQGPGRSIDPGEKLLCWQVWEALLSSRAGDRCRVNCQPAWELHVLLQVWELQAHWPHQ